MTSPPPQKDYSKIRKKWTKSIYKEAKLDKKNPKKSKKRTKKEQKNNNGRKKIKRKRAGWLRRILRKSVITYLDGRRTVGQNQVDLSHLIIHFPTSSGLSKWASNVSSAEQANEWAVQTNEQIDKLANGRASGPVLTSRLLFILNHCGKTWREKSWHFLKLGMTNSPSFVSFSVFFLLAFRLSLSFFLCLFFPFFYRFRSRRRLE